MNVDHTKCSLASLQPGSGAPWLLVLLILLASGALPLFWVSASDEKSAVLAPSALPLREELPDPFRMRGGRRVATLADWRAQRVYLAELVLNYQYGQIPTEKVTVRARQTASREVAGGAATERRFELLLGTRNKLRLRVGLTVPNVGGPFPVVIKNEGSLGPHPPILDALIKRGYALCEYVRTDLDPDARSVVGPAQAAYPEHDWGTIAVWAWGGMRVVDFLVSRSDIDSRAIIVTGHSRGGKVAFLHGALDERVALTNPNGSGAGGAATYRAQGPKSETLELITQPERFGYWFRPRFREFAGHESRLPFDQHTLAALIAPRALLTTDARDDLWASPVGTQETLRAAREIYRFFGATDRVGLALREGRHDQTAGDWRSLLDFADQVLRGRSPPSDRSFDRDPFPDSRQRFAWRAPPFPKTVRTAKTAAAELSAGVSRVDLTPPAELKAPLGGYGARMNRPAEGVHDRIFAKALVISDGTRKFAFVTADMLGFSPPIKSAVLDLLTDAGWSSEQVILLASHSHTSIEMNAINPRNIFDIPQIGIHNQRLFELTVKRLASAVRHAERELVPVSIGTSAQSISGWNRNRRSRDGPTDDQLTVTRVDRTDGTPLAILVNFAAHPTFMGEHQMLFSGGWPGHLQRSLEAIVGDGVTAMYYNGAEGDQRPQARPGSGSSRWEQAERYGRELALLARKQWKTTRTERGVAFGYHRQVIDLPDPSAHPDFMKTGGEEYGLSEKLMEKFLPRMCPGRSASISVRIGELLVVGVPGEMAAELGLTVKARASRLTGAKFPVIGGLADEWISYILSEEQYDEGGYEASVSFYGSSLGRIIVSGTLEGVERMVAH